MTELSWAGWMAWCAWCRDLFLFNVAGDALPGVAMEEARVVEILETRVRVPANGDTMAVQESAYREHGRGGGEKVRILSACFVKGDVRAEDKSTMDAVRRLLEVG